MHSGCNLRDRQRAAPDGPAVRASGQEPSGQPGLRDGRGQIAAPWLEREARGRPSRCCVRRVCGWRAFPLVLALCSTHSTTGCPALFPGFVATTARSDASNVCIIGLGSSPSRCGPPADTGTDGHAGDLPVPAQGACAHARVCDRAGSVGHLRWRTRPCCLKLRRQRRHPKLSCYRGSMADLCVPLSTLHSSPRSGARITREQHDSLCPCCEGHSPVAPCRFYRRTEVKGGGGVQADEGHERNPVILPGVHARVRASRSWPFGFS